MNDLVIRASTRSDNRALAALAAQTGEDRPPQPCMVAIAGGRMQAALSLRGGPLMAHPECAGTGVAGLLRLRADEEVRRRQTTEQRARSRRLRTTFARIGV